VVQATVFGDDEPSRPWATHTSLVRPVWMVWFEWVHEVTCLQKFLVKKEKLTLDMNREVTYTNSNFTRYITTEVFATEITTIKRIVQLQVY
jgi:hypothetical protein